MTYRNNYQTNILSSLATMPLWVKEIAKKTLIRTFFIYCSVFLLYCLVDFSINSFRFSSAATLVLCKYYLIQASKYLDIFLPVSFLISMVRTLSEMNVNKELLALFSAGLSKNRLFMPFFFIAALLSLICLYNVESIIPKTSAFMNGFQQKFFANKNKNAKKNVHSIFLSDYSHFIFSKYDQNSKVLEDIFWIKNFNDIWHIEKIELSTPPKGYFLDHLVREHNNRLVKADSHQELIIDDLPLTDKILEESLIPLEQTSLSKLIASNKNEKNAEKKTLASIKIIFSISFFWIVVCIAPYCIYFSRDFSPIFTLGISIFSFVCFYTMINTLSILCTNQIMSYWTALWLPSIFLLMLGAYNFSRNVHE